MGGAVSALSLGDVPEQGFLEAQGNDKDSDKQGIYFYNLISGTSNPT